MHAIIKINPWNKNKSLCVFPRRHLVVSGNSIDNLDQVDICDVLHVSLLVGYQQIHNYWWISLLLKRGHTNIEQLAISITSVFILFSIQNAPLNYRQKIKRDCRSCAKQFNVQCHVVCLNKYKPVKEHCSTI